METGFSLFVNRQRRLLTGQRFAVSVILRKSAAAATLVHAYDGILSTESRRDYVVVVCGVFC